MILNFFEKAKAHIKGGKAFPNIDGIVYFKEIKEGVMLTAKINGLPRSKFPCKRKLFWISYP